MLEGKPGARPILSYWTGSGVRTIYELPPLTREQKLAAAAHWRNLAQDSIASGQHESAVGISTGQTHQHNAALYIEIAEKIEVEDDSGDIVAIVHCESVWMPFTQAEIEAKDKQTMSGLKPSNYTSHPMSSVSKEWEAEQIARNIMTILWRTGDEWRPLAWEEYCTERQKDGNFSEMERPYFDRVVSYCKSAEDADRFCSSWRK